MIQERLVPFESTCCCRWSNAEMSRRIGHLVYHDMLSILDCTILSTKESTAHGCICPSKGKLNIDLLT